MGLMASTPQAIPVNPGVGRGLVRLVSNDQMVAQERVQADAARLAAEEEMVEDALASHPTVAQVVVIGVPDERWGESVKAVVVLREGFEPDAELEADLQQWVKKAKGSVQTPKSVDFVTAIPLTPVGKPDKKAVRARYWQGSERGVG